MVSFSGLQQWGLALAVLAGCETASAATTQQWKSRTIYQTMTDRFALTAGTTAAACNTTAGLYCGGTWRGTIDKLDYIQGMGFDAVMISPIIQNIDGRASYGEAYHGYWPNDLYSLNSRFGTHQDLLDLSAAVHARGMYLMMDTVINNMAYMTAGKDPATNIDYATLTPFNSSSYYHSYCEISNWNNYTQAQLCQTGDEIVALPDLYTEHEAVQDLLVDWAKQVIATYSIDGLRIDAAKSVNPSFLTTFHDRVGTFMTGEVFEQNASVVCDYQNHYLPSLPNFPLYYTILDAFTRGNPSALFQRIALVQDLCTDVPAMPTFIENHDVDRFAFANDDLTLAKNAITFEMLYDGIPWVYQGQEQHLNGSYAGTHNREALWETGYNTGSELYVLISKLNRLRKHAYQLDPNYIDLQTVPLYQGGSELGFWKGAFGRQVVMLLSTQGSTGSAYNVTLPMTYGAGIEVVEVLSCVNYTVNPYSQLIVPMDKGEPRVFFRTDLMPGSGLCGYSSNSTSLTHLRLSAAAAAAAAAAPSGGESVARVSWGVMAMVALVGVLLV
ncbi:alpha-amylase [Aspergillus saccharolyticus JOP 1030-1]|uniref:alpha-amylase n=1 Tax=Aspergillus saccharolyticus JOP 1030-1 TaxID=1450539 RepID=A0A318Z986_9EURO|nr:putative alpha-amylase [Aspergillus saccharolyticus JOP 1030-1]PYH42944.1 putative alpha-amylase [Aspergillus saccharolyticus JOP 1030-1]